MQSTADQTVHSAVMEKLYGRNLWEGFEPTREPGVVHGWNGLHRILKRLPPEASPPILIDVGSRRLDVELSEEVLQERMQDWKPPTPRYVTGVLAKYARLVSSASAGAVTG